MDKLKRVPARAGAIIGYTRRGTPIYPISGAETPSYGEIIDRTTNADAVDTGPIELPPEVVTELIAALPSQSAALALCRRRTMSARVQRQSVMDTLPLAYWVGGDTGLKQTTAAAWRNKFLIAAELAALVPVPQSVLDDEAFPIWDEVLPYLVEAAGVLIDEAVLFGVGKPTEWTDPSIVEHATAAGNELVRGTLPADSYGNTPDISVDLGGEGGIMQLVANDGFRPRGFAVDGTFESTLMGLRDANGQPVFLAGLASQPGQTDSIYRRPVAYINSGAFDTDNVLAIAGDFSYAIIGVRQDITVRSFTEGVVSDDDGKVVLNLMQQDSAALRLVMRLGYALANPVTRRQPDPANRSPFAVLRPADYVGPGS